MPPRVKFPLDMGNGVLVRNIDELKENFNAEKVTEYFLNGKLLVWLNDRYYDEEAEQVEALSSEADKSLLSEKLCGIFGIETKDSIDVEALERRRERLEKLRSVTSDDAILSNVDYVAFSQEELGDLLDEDAEVIYLCGEKFRIPFSVHNKKYIGINTPVVDISTKSDRIDLKKCGIVVENCDFSEKTQAKMKTACEGVVEVERGDVETDHDDIDEIIYDTEDEDYDGEEAFKADTRPYKELNSEKVTGIIIPDGVTRIVDCAFRGFRYLKTIKIPDSVTSIGSCAFDFCESLEEVVIPQNVTVIESGAFGDCRKIKSIVVPDNVTEIGCAAFDGCASLESVNIPNGVTVIEDNVFSKCGKLTEINIPDSITEIGESAFEDCSSLERVDIPSGVTVIKDSAFSGCSGLSEINFEYGLTEIGSWAFYECESLKSLVLPDSVVKIEMSAFEDCVGLESVKLSSKLEEVDLGWFDGCSELHSIEIPDGIKSVRVSSLVPITSLTIPESVPYDEFSYLPSDDDTIRELNLPLSYRQDFSIFEKELPSDCKLNYYSGQTVFTDKEKRSRLAKYLKNNSYKTGLKVYTWYYGSQISGDAKNNIKSRVQGLNKTADIVAAYDKNLALFAGECKGKSGIVFTTEGFAVYDSSMTLNASTPLIKYEDFGYISRDGSRYTVWLTDMETTYSLYEESTLNEDGFGELIESIVNMDYLK